VGDPRWGSLFLKDCTLETHAGAAHGKDSCWRHLWRIVSHGRDPKLEQGKTVSSPSPEEEGAAEMTCDELIANPIPQPPALLGEGGGRENLE